MIYYVWNRYLGLYPTPSQANDNIRLHYVPKPKTLSSDTDVPEIDSQYHEALGYYAAWKLAERFAPKKALALYQQWLEWKFKVLSYGQHKHGEGIIRPEYVDF